MSGDGEPGLLLQDLSGTHSLPLAVETMPCNADMSMRPDRPERDNEAPYRPSAGVSLHWHWAGAAGMTGGTCGVKIGHSKVPPLEGPIVPAKPRKKNCALLGDP